jgi:hypothetical protein
MSLSDEGEHMMLAYGNEADVLDYHDVLGVVGREEALHDVIEVPAIEDRLATPLCSVGLVGLEYLRRSTFTFALPTLGSVPVLLDAGKIG